MIIKRNKEILFFYSFDIVISISFEEDEHCIFKYYHDFVIFFIKRNCTFSILPTLLLEKGFYCQERGSICTGAGEDHESL